MRPDGGLMAAVKASDLMVARRANAKARADFATWSMMEKLNGISALSAEARNYLATYRSLRASTAEAEATETMIGTIYAAYYKEMGGSGTAPPLPAASHVDVTDNVTEFRKIAPKASTSAKTERRLPVAMIFLTLVAIAIAFKFLFR